MTIEPEKIMNKKNFLETLIFSLAAIPLIKLLPEIGATTRLTLVSYCGRGNVGLGTTIPNAVLILKN